MPNKRSAPAKASPKLSASDDASPSWRRLFGWHFVVLLAVIVFFGAIRWRLADMPLERDEGEYAYAGQLMLQGIAPYHLAYNMKLPGTYAAYAAIMAVFGQTDRGIHLGFLLVNAISIILVYVLAALLFGNLAGTVAGAGYALLTTHQSVYGFAAHATHFVVLAALAGLILALRAEETRHPIFFFWSGLAFGIAFLMKQPGIVLGVFGFIYLAVQCWPRDNGKSARMPWARNLGIFLLAAALPFALTCLILYCAGVFHNFWFWTFSYASRYAAVQSLGQGWVQLLSTAEPLLHWTLWLWILALIGLLTALWDRRARVHAFFVIGLAVFSFAAVCPGFYFRQHYYVLLLPAASLLIALAVTSAMSWLNEKVSSKWILVLPVFVFAAAWGGAIYQNREAYFELSPLQVCHWIYLGNPFIAAEQAADYLRQHTSPSDTIMVFGSSWRFISTLIAILRAAISICIACSKNSPTGRSCRSR